MQLRPGVLQHKIEAKTWRGEIVRRAQIVRRHTDVVEVFEYVSQQQYVDFQEQVAVLAEGRVAKALLRRVYYSHYHYRVAHLIHHRKHAEVVTLPCPIYPNYRYTLLQVASNMSSDENSLAVSRNLLK